MNPIRLTAVVFAILGGGPFLAAQSPAPPPPAGGGAQQQQPVFRAGVELVRLDVRVVDGQGVPIMTSGQRRSPSRRRGSLVPWCSSST
jgi:hypothetical protein